VEGNGSAEIVSETGNEGRTTGGGRRTIGRDGVERRGGAEDGGKLSMVRLELSAAGER
jgi:hypothetical protein